MISLVEALQSRTIGSVDSVEPDRIIVALNIEAPQSLALNTRHPFSFPRLNSYVLLPHERGATVAIVESIRTRPSIYPKRKGTERDFMLVDLPFPTRELSVLPLGTLHVIEINGNTEFEVRRGVESFPSIGDMVTLPTDDQLRAIVEGESDQSRRVQIGTAPLAHDAPVSVDPDKLFGRHLAVLGNTGAGKSCSVAGLIRWCLEKARRTKKDHQELSGWPNARFIILDPNGEYARAFKSFDARVFRVEPQENDRHLCVPAWLWNGEEWTGFTNAAPGVQRPILLDAIRRLKSGGGRTDTLEIELRNFFRRTFWKIKTSIDQGDHQNWPGKDDLGRVLEDVAEMLAEFANRAKEISNLEFEIRLRELGDNVRSTASEASYVSKVGKKGFNAIKETSLRAILCSIEQLAQNFGGLEIELRCTEDAPVHFNLQNLPGYVEALASSVNSRDIGQFVDTLNLRIRRLVSHGTLRTIASPDNSIELEEWLTDFIGDNQAKQGCISVIDFSLVPSEAVHIIVSVVSRLIFEALQRYRIDHEHRKPLPTVLVLEEAHNFAHRDMGNETTLPTARLCSRIVEKIAREGRKFGLGLVVSSQRPSELSQTVLAQCNTFLLHRLVNDQDQNLVRRLVPEGLGNVLRELPSLPSGRAILLGAAVPAPVLVDMKELPDHHRPQSPDPDYWNVWTNQAKHPRNIDWSKIASQWAENKTSEGENSTDPEGTTDNH